MMLLWAEAHHEVRFPQDLVLSSWASWEKKWWDQDQFTGATWTFPAGFPLTLLVTTSWQRRSQMVIMCLWDVTNIVNVSQLPNNWIVITWLLGCWDG